MNFLPLDFAEEILLGFDLEMLYAIWNGCSFYDEQLVHLFGVESLSLRSLLLEKHVVEKISLKYDSQETYFGEFLFAFDRNYFFSNLVGDAYRQARWTSNQYGERFPNSPNYSVIYRTIREAGKHEQGRFALWLAHQEEILKDGKYQSILLRALSYDFKLIKIYAKLLVEHYKGCDCMCDFECTCEDDLYQDYLYIASLQTTKLKQYRGKGVCMDGFSFLSTDLLYLPESRVRGDFYLACIRKGNLGLYAHPERVPETKKPFLTFTVPSKEKILKTICTALNDGCCCSILDFVKFFALSADEIFFVLNHTTHDTEEDQEVLDYMKLSM